jgi:hypothetical protein
VTLHSDYPKNTQLRSYVGGMLCFSKAGYGGHVGRSLMCVFLVHDG